MCVLDFGQVCRDVLEADVLEALRVVLVGGHEDGDDVGCGDRLLDGVLAEALETVEEIPSGGSISGDSGVSTVRVRLKLLVSVETYRTVPRRSAAGR